MQANSSSGLLSWNLQTLLPNKGPWPNVAFGDVHVVDEEAEEEERRQAEEEAATGSNAYRRRTSSGGGGSPQKRHAAAIAATADSLAVGSKVIAVREGHKTR